MKKYLLIVSALLFSAAMLHAQPKLEIIGGDTYNWGDVSPKQSPLKAKVQLKNIGNEKLEITNVRPACGCTTAPLDKNALLPDEIATLDISLRISQRAGATHKTIAITTNEPKNYRHIFHLKAEVIMPISITPTSYFTFMNVFVGNSAESIVNLKNTSGKTIKFSDIETSPETFTVALTGPFELKAGEKIEIRATAKPVKKGYYNCLLKMKTTHPDYPEVRIPGYGNIKDSPIFNNE